VDGALMPGNSKRKGAIRKSSKRPTAGSGGRVRQGLEGRGPTPKAADRPNHKAHKFKVKSEQSASAQHSELAMQAPLQSLKPELHVKPHAPLAQVAVAFVTAGQAAQLPPQEFTLVFERQRPLQSCVPMGQTPMQAAPFAMQTLAQTFSPIGHFAPQVVPSHVAAPPCGAEQAEQEVPHDAGELSSEQPPLQAWKPAPHEKPHRWLALQVAVPWVTAGHSAAMQQVADAMHVVPQRL